MRIVEKSTIVLTPTLKPVRKFKASFTFLRALDPANQNHSTGKM